MFPTQSKVNRSSSLWLLPIVALVMLLVAYAIFAASKVQAQTPAGDFCIEGIVIDWEENPLSGWAITLTSDITIPGGITMSGGVTSATGVSTTISAFDPDDGDDEHWGPDNGNGYDKKGGPDSKHEGGPDYNNQNGPSHDDRNGPSYNDSKGGPKDGHKDEHGPEFSRNGREEEDDDEAANEAEGLLAGEGNEAAAHPGPKALLLRGRFPTLDFRDVTDFVSSHAGPPSYLNRIRGSRNA